MSRIVPSISFNVGLDTYARALADCDSDDLNRVLMFVSKKKLIESATKVCCKCDGVIPEEADTLWLVSLCQGVSACILA